jgi:hypothetical protein
VRLLDYVAASWAGMLPGTFAYVYLGSVGREAVSAAGAGGLDSGAKVALYGGRPGCCYCCCCWRWWMCEAAAAKLLLSAAASAAAAGRAAAYHAGLHR